MTDAIPLDALRDALNALRDHSDLSGNALIGFLGLADEHDASAALRETLRDAIHALRPLPQRPSDERPYRILYQRYVLGRTQYAVAQGLDITPRHLRREQWDAIAVLADYLNVRFDIGGARQCAARQRSLPLVGIDEAELRREMVWLADHQADRTCNLDRAIAEALELVETMARGGQVHVDRKTELPHSTVAAPHTVVKQAVLNLLSTLVRGAALGARIEVYVRQRASCCVATLVTRGAEMAGDEAGNEILRAAQVSAGLLKLFGGELDVSSIGDMLIVRMEIPCAEERVDVLAIEDNTDTLRLWQRYVQRTRFNLVTESDARRAVERAVALQPDIIVLDVMLEASDGWEVLSRLRGHQETEGIPVVICTVLPQRDLALSLGASGFIQKPSTGREFRAVLEALTV